MAFVAGYAISLTVAYLLNSLVNFKQRPGFKKYIKFCISYIPNFIIQFITVLIAHNLLGLKEITAYAIAAIIGVPLTFLFTKFFVFEKKDASNQR